MQIDFGIWAPTEEIARQSWIDAGILENTSGWNFTTNYPGIVVTANSGWSGIIDKDDSPIPGWHCNARVTGSVAEAMTAGLPQEGSIWDRTWAAYIFQLTEVDTDPVTGFPTGYRNNASGVKYCDLTEFKSPSNVIA